MQYINETHTEIYEIVQIYLCICELTIHQRLGQLIFGQIQGGQSLAYQTSAHCGAILTNGKGLARCHDHFPQQSDAHLGMLARHQHVLTGNWKKR